MTRILMLVIILRVITAVTIAVMITNIVHAIITWACDSQPRILSCYSIACDVSLYYIVLGYMLYIYIYTHITVHVHVYMYIHIYIYIYIYTYVICVCKCVYVCIYIYILVGMQFAATLRKMAWYGWLPDAVGTN